MKIVKVIELCFIELFLILLYANLIGIIFSNLFVGQLFSSKDKMSTKTCKKMVSTDDSNYVPNSVRRRTRYDSIEGMSPLRFNSTGSDPESVSDGELSAVSSPPEVDLGRM